jgi:hypothetical protein
VIEAESKQADGPSEPHEHQVVPNEPESRGSARPLLESAETRASVREDAIYCFGMATLCLALQLVPIADAVDPVVRHQSVYVQIGTFKAQTAGDAGSELFRG